VQAKPFRYMPSTDKPVTCSTGEVVISYRDYLKTRHWANVRRRFISSKLFDGGCALCKRREKLQLHHKSYKRIGHEYLWDLVMLCDHCHSTTHTANRNPTSQKHNLWNAHKRVGKRMRKAERIQA
jgi:hypothetical protein